MQTSDLIQKILSAKKLSQADLAGLLGVNQSQITRWLAGSEPGTAACLLLAGLADSEEERAYWMRESRLSRAQLLSIASALDLPPPARLAGDELALIDWWRHPIGPVEQSLKDFVSQLLKVRSISAHGSGQKHP